MNLVPGVNANHGRMLLLAPGNVFIPDILRGVKWNPQRHRNLLVELQRLRGRVYLSDGPIHRAELTSTDVTFTALTTGRGILSH